MGGSRETSSPRETQKSSKPSVSRNTGGEKGIQGGIKAVTEKLTKLIEQTNNVLAQARDSSKPVKDRVKLINAPEIKKLMAVFQETKKDPKMQEYTKKLGMQIDNLWEQFQDPLREYAFSQKEEFLTKLHKEENALRVREQEIAQNGIQRIQGPLGFDGPLPV